MAEMTLNNNEIVLENKINNNLNIEDNQKKFLETSLGKVINTGIDIGLRYVLPDIIENQIIDIKNTLIENGLKEGEQEAINSSIELGKSSIGIITGKFENISQVQTVIKNGGILDNISNILDKVIKKSVESNKISNSTGNIIKNGKNTIINSISKNIENEFENQIDNIEKLDKYCNNWKECYNNKDFEGMTKEYNKIKIKIKEIIPIENTIKNARVIENLQNLINNNNQKFNLTKEQLELANML